MNKVFKVGLIGCGHIAETYFRAHKYFNNFKIIKCADINNEAAIKCAKANKIKAVSIKELLNDYPNNPPNPILKPSGKRYINSRYNNTN